MINIDPLCIDNNQFAKDAFESKNEPRKTNLLSNYLYIKDDYRAYNTNKHNLENLKPDIRVAASRISDDLRHCYNNSTKIVAGVKQRIKDNIPTKNKGRCLYCMISEASTLDHYIDKSEFPEFSIYTDNLIPCCAYCNTRKKEQWRIGDQRLILNNYFDEFISQNYLFIDIGLSKAKSKMTPYVKEVRLDFSGVMASPYSIKLVENHYDLLNLRKRYKDKAADLLDQIVEESIEPYKMDKISLENNIKRRLLAFEKKHGYNHWETAVCRGILANDDLMKWLTEES